MSIVIALGVTTPETSYSDMAAGSDPESVEASPAVNEKNYNNHSCGSAQSHGYRGLPYAMQQSSVVCCQDHNYGAPPPPTPPASPLSQTIIPRMDLNGVVRSARYHETTEDNSADSDSSSDEDGCHGCQSCSLTPDGLLIKCDYCRLDRRKGVEGQHRKSENVSAGESSATESGDEEVSPSTISYTATQHTPTSIKLTVNRVKRSKSKKRKKSTEKARGTPKVKKVKAFREGSRKSMRMKNSTTEASVLDENTAEGWESRIRQWTDQYEEALANQYSADIQTLLQLHRAANSSVAKTESGGGGGSTPPSTAGLQASLDTMDTINRTELACNNTVLGSQMQLQLGRVTRVQKHRKILRAAKTLEPDTLIIEYRGKVMLKQQFEVNGHFFKKPYPFVLFYSKFNDVEMCVDARTFGNDARFIRRSCTPNAEVRHMIAEGMIHLCIYAVSQITKDAEVTIGFDYEFNSCNYKVDCACHKGNQNCPVQKHNLSPRETLLSPPTLLPPSPLVGAETRRRKARRRELEDGQGGDAGQALDQHQEAKDLQGTSDAEERLLEEVKVEEAEEGEVDENGITLSTKKTFNSVARRGRRVGGADVKDDGAETEDGAGNPTGSAGAPHSSGVGVSTRRTTYVMETPTVEEKTTLPNPPAPAAPPKPARPSKPRPKSRISRYRSSSSQRARRRQTLAQQAAAAAAAVAATPTSAEQGATLDEDGSQGPYGAELGHGESGMGAGHLPDGDQGLGCINKGNLRYPKTKKYLVTEWLNEKVPGGEKLHQELPVDRPLRITTDPTVLATTLNMLPGLSHSSLICTAPRHYIRFGSPFNPERRRPRPLQMDGTYGCFKKRWIKQVEDESCSASVEDGTESTSSQQSTSSRSTPNPLSSELNAPFKKRRAKYLPEPAPAPSDHLLRPLSPITPPLPEDGVLPLLHNPRGALLPNGLAYSPMPSLPASRCNTPLQFENISSPEASPVHRPESISPEPQLQPDFDIPRPPFPDLSLPSSLESPLALASDDFSLSAAAAVATASASGLESQGGAGPAPLNPLSCPPSDIPPQPREQAFRTEFNLIYTCSPLNANLGGAALADRRLSQSEGGFSPAESFHGSLGGAGLLGDAAASASAGSMSPYSEPHYGGGYPDSGTPPHAGNPPQKKKVSLLEYRKRKQGSSREPPEPAGCGSSLGGGGGGGVPPPRPTPHYAQDPLAHLPMQPPPPASPHSSAPPAASNAAAAASSATAASAHAAASLPQMEEVSPPDHQPRRPDNNQWMVPTSVERLREGQGVLERVLRSIKMERVYKRGDAPNDKEADADRYELQAAALASPMKSPHTYSPSVYSHQASDSSHRQSDSPSFLQQTSSNSPFRGSYSPSSSSSSGAGFYPRAPPPDHQAPPPAHAPEPPSSLLLLHQQQQQSGGATTAAAAALRSQPAAQTKAEWSAAAAAAASRGSQPRLKTASASAAAAASAATNYSQRAAGLAQFQHSPLPGSGVRTQSGSF